MHADKHLFLIRVYLCSSAAIDSDEFFSNVYSRRILAELEVRDAVVPEVWPFEIANIIFVSFSKRKRITEQQIGEYLDRLRAMPIRVESNDLWANIGLESRARKWNVAAYDAAYLDLASRRNLPLATADERLKKAAVAGGISVLN
ncbi:MAG TPA: type II toxin-antitoxin system VapC family toxin [Bryobacteraceae bacterium]